MKKLNHKLISLFPFLITIFILSGCINRYAVEQWTKEPVVRVLVGENVASVAIEASGNHTLSTESESFPVIGAAKWDISTGQSLSVVLNGTKNLTNPTLPIKIAPDERTVLKLNGKPYRGWLAVTPGTTSGFNVINLLPMEQYLYGVVPREIGQGTPDIMNAVEAQAICARSYAVTRMGSHRKQGFDIYADTRDQAYGGMAIESPVCTKAVEETRGEVAFVDDKILDARYHSTCGGYTANSEEAWTAVIPYLRTVRDAPFLGKAYCATSPHFTWSQAVPKEKFYGMIASAIPNGAKVRTWQLDINPKSRRVIKMIVNTDQGKFEIKGPVIRTTLGLKSTYFKVREEGSNMVFEGHGWGHGVGMCQYGAMEMARQGASAKRILKHYYKGVWLGELYE